MEVHRKDGEIENRPVSKGGRAFDFLTYFGFATVGTFFATIPIAKSMISGRAKFIADGLNKGLINIGISKPLAEEATKVTNYMWGGNLMLIPVGIMEYNRTAIVNAFNRLFKDPTDPKSIEDAPPQTAGSILKGRLVAWSTVFVGFKAATKIMGKEGYEKALDVAGNAWAKLRRNPASYQNGRIGAEDALATLSAASLLYVGSHFFAKRAYERRVTKDYLEQKRAEVANDAPPEVMHTPNEATISDAPALLPTPTPGDRPLPQISHVQHEHALAAAPEQQAQLPA